MRLRILLEPPGELADSLFKGWLARTGLPITRDGLVEIDSGQCHALLLDLRNRCYDQGLTLGVNFTGSEIV
jgi:hypothetical protein